MKTFALTFISFIFLSVLGRAQDPIGTNRQERKVLKLINAIPAVFRAEKYISKTTDGKRHLKAYIESTPTKQEPYYNVSVGDDANDHLLAHFRFRVYVPNYAICYLDLENEKLVPLRTWNKKPYGIYSTGKH